jgi:hypothetical protein
MRKDPLSMSNDERRRYVQDFVAEFETRLKSHIFTYYKTTGQENGFPVQLRSFFKSNPIQKPPIDPNTATLKELLDHKKFILHFSTLRKVYVKFWTTLGQVFTGDSIDQNSFIKYMNELNAGRTDADHYTPSELRLPTDAWDIDDDTIQRFILAKNKMENVFH